MISVYDAHPLAYSSNTNIRVIELLYETDFTKPLSFRLNVVALNDAPDYRALSYV
jgi:hypothetical protein